MEESRGIDGCERTEIGRAWAETRLSTENADRAEVRKLSLVSFIQKRDRNPTLIKLIQLIGTTCQRRQRDEFVRGNRALLPLPRVLLPRVAVLFAKGPRLPPWLLRLRIIIMLLTRNRTEIPQQTMRARMVRVQGDQRRPT